MFQHIFVIFHNHCSARMHIVIIGNGISGITAARHIRKQSDFRITVISKESEYFFSRTALMYVYMGHMKFEHTKPYEDWFWKKNRIELLFDEVKSINKAQQTLLLTSGGTVSFDQLIIASGSKPNKFGWPGQDLIGVQGLYSKQDLENMQQLTSDAKHAVIVGGGLIGVEMAEMLASRNIKVTFLIREKNFWDGVLPKEEAMMIGSHIRDHHIDLRTETNLVEICPDTNGKVKSITTDKGDIVECQFVGLTVGVSPLIDFLKDSGIECNRGVLVNEYLETNVTGIFAIGDCAEFRTPLPNRKPVEQVWYTGRMMGETIAKTICNKRSVYNPGIWFNAAKFFDIEYQTYGWVFPNLKEGDEAFYWQHPVEKISLRIHFNKQSRAVNGINVFGIRLRHESCDKWIHEGRSIEFVLEHLPEANFDPECYRQYESQIIQKFNRENSGANLSLKTKRGLWQKKSG